MKPGSKAGFQFLSICLVLVYGMYVVRRLEPGFTFAKYDPGWMISAVQSIVEDRDLDLRNQLKNDPNEAADQTAQGIGGQWYPLHECLMAVATVPFYLLLGIPGCLVFNVLMVILLMLIVYSLCCRHVDQQTALIAVTLTGFTTLFYDYTYSYSLDVFGALVLVIAYRLVISGKPGWGGLAWGLAVLGRTPNAVTGPAFFVFLLLQPSIPGDAQPFPGRLRDAALFILGSVPALAALAVGNWAMFGSPLATAYSRWQHFENGQAVLSSQGGAFSASLFDRLPAVLFDTKSGLFFGAPLLLLALCFGMRPLWRRARSEAILLSLTSLCLIALFSKYSLAVPGYPGNRYLMSVVALGAVPLSMAVKDAMNGRRGASIPPH
jgi:hypothetical protein